MSRKDFPFMLARLIREDVKKLKDESQPIEQDAATRFTSTPPSWIRRFIDIDRNWDAERMISMLPARVEWLEAQISKYQKRVDDNPAVPGNSRIKEIRKEKEREFGFGELRHLLPVRAMKQELEIIAQNEMSPRIPERSFLERFPDTPKGREDLLARRDARLKLEAYENAKAKKAFRERMKATQKDKGPGHWEFENEEEETVAHVFLRNIYDGQIMADDVYREQLFEEKVSVVLSIRLKWVEDGVGVRHPGSGKGSFKREQKRTLDASTMDERDEIVVNTPDEHTKSVKLPTDITSKIQEGTGVTGRKRKQGSSPDAVETASNKKQKKPLNATSPIKLLAAAQGGTDAMVRKRKEQSTPDVVEATASKKQKMATRRIGDPKFANAKHEMKYLADEIAKLTPAWLRWVYQEYSSTAIAQGSNDSN